MTTLQKKLDHSKAAYKFAINSLPNLSLHLKFPIPSSGFNFENNYQINSMIVEFGWSFFCRYEAIIESYLKEKGIKLSKRLSLKKWLTDNGVTIPYEYNEGLALYRKIRNQLHHEDGATFDKSKDREIHILPEHMQKYYDLFLWCSKEIEKIIDNKSLE